MRFDASIYKGTIDYAKGVMVIPLEISLGEIAQYQEGIAAYAKGKVNVSILPANGVLFNKVQDLLDAMDREIANHHWRPRRLDADRDRVGEDLKAKAAAQEALPGTEEAPTEPGEETTPSCDTCCRNEDCDHVVVDGCFVAVRADSPELAHPHERREDLTCAEHDCSNCAHKEKRWAERAEGEPLPQPCANCSLTSVDNEGPDCYWEPEVTAEVDAEPAQVELEPHVWTEEGCSEHSHGCVYCGRNKAGEGEIDHCELCHASDPGITVCHFTPGTRESEAATIDAIAAEEGWTEPAPATIERIGPVTGECTEVPIVQKSFLTPEDAQEAAEQDPDYDPFAVSPTDNEDGSQEDGEEAENPFLQPA